MQKMAMDESKAWKRSIWRRRSARSGLSAEAWFPFFPRRRSGLPCSVHLPRSKMKASGPQSIKRPLQKRCVARSDPSVRNDEDGGERPFDCDHGGSGMRRYRRQDEQACGVDGRWRPELKTQWWRRQNAFCLQNAIASNSVQILRPSV